MQKLPTLATVVRFLGAANSALALVGLLRFVAIVGQTPFSALYLAGFLTNWGAALALLHFCLPREWAPRTLFHLALCACVFVTTIFWPLYIYDPGTMIDVEQAGSLRLPIFFNLMLHAFPSICLLLEPLVSHTHPVHSWLAGLVPVLVYHAAYCAMIFVWRTQSEHFPYPFLERLWQYVMSMGVPAIGFLGVFGAATLVAMSRVLWRYSQWAAALNAKKTPDSRV